MRFIKIFMMVCLFIGTSVFAQVNVNTASAEELSALKGIGEKKAAAIIKYRKANGKFKSVSELVNVLGIGEKILKNLGRDVRVSGRTDLTKLKNKKSTTKRKSVTKKSSVTRKDSKSFHTEQANVVSAARSKVEPIVEPPSEELGYQDAKIVDSMADNSVVEQEVDSVSPSEKSAEEVEEEIDTIVQNFGSDGVEEDPELLQAIQDVVQSRLDDMDGGPASAD